MSRRITLIVCDPSDTRQLERMTEEVDAILDNNPGATLTWLQSADSEHHVLTCAVEMGISDPKTSEERIEANKRAISRGKKISKR